MPTEDGHRELRSLLREGSYPVITSELSEVEFASAVSAAARSGRLRGPDRFMARFDSECLQTGLISRLFLRPSAVVAEAARLCTVHPIRALDALHLAVALLDGRAVAGDELTFVTRDRVQAAAARSEGLLLA